MNIIPHFPKGPHGNASSPDDGRAAVGISVTLSGQLITAALGMIAVVGAFATFIIDKRVISGSFWLCFFVSLISFVISIICGGNGITSARNSGFHGQWNLNSGKKMFNRQAQFLLVGLLMFVSLILVGRKPKDDDTQKALLSLETRIQAISDRVDNLYTPKPLTKSQQAPPATPLVTTTPTVSPTPTPVSSTPTAPPASNPKPQTPTGTP